MIRVARDGALYDAMQLQGPLLVNTAAGETCLEAGMWLLQPVAGGWPIGATDDEVAAMTVIEED